MWSSNQSREEARPFCCCQSEDREGCEEEVGEFRAQAKKVTG